MNVFFSRTTWMTGLAIFSMFFGAGNVVFPLVLGQMAGDQIFAALPGLLLTSIGGPLFGLFGTILYKGDYKAFFSRTGRIPGYLLMLVCAGLLGPFAVMPRCVVLTYASFQPYFPELSLFSFSILFGIVALACTVKRDTILSLLGGFLSPVLLGSLALIIYQGMNSSPRDLPSFTQNPLKPFGNGLLVGYDTMDLIASIFFAFTVWKLLREQFQTTDIQDSRLVKQTTIAAGCLGGLFLGLIYVGLSLVAALHSPVINDVPPESLLSTLCFHLLGPFQGDIATLAVALACLTTVISLGVTFAEVLQKEFSQLQISYSFAIILIMLWTTIFANLGFSQLMSIIHPIVSVCYPAIIVLTFCNVMHKLYGWTTVKLPVFATFAVTLGLDFFNRLG
ncbi:branched-chain amino acid transport system II carrier protein [Parachlamydia sp. AcF125]|uniref:branched-chain amino acid transport system II carrier protein n=1 Tax=Parachlamydia sp. AcF125 TaxID=2795736 RepID=UPI001BC8EE15|nr:branched-chain amino acid transport system II carrier protein [Parachlamydia sp. AcF125]MBS4168395.1 Branched-chain amino acid transport system 2 carrier protein [Parachlamydia sp. AcF125]